MSSANSFDSNVSISFVTGLADLGAHAALEHFGNGVCSLATLKTVDVDYIKIAPSLVRQVEHDNESASTIRAIVEMAHIFDRETIAFGVEEADSLAKLWSFGIDYVQGNGIQSASSELRWDFVSTEIY